MDELVIMSGVRAVLAVDGAGARPGMKWPRSGATEADMGAINALPGVLEPLAPDDVFVRSVYAVNDLPLLAQYRGLRIGAEAVRGIAALAPRAPVQCNHDTGWLAAGRDALPVATVFRADSVVEGGVTWARMALYWAATEANAELVARVDAGNIGEVSIGAGFGRVQCGICGLGAGDCEHKPLETYAGRECLYVLQDPTSLSELSLVWKGAAQGTHFYMAAAHGGASTDAGEFVRSLGIPRDPLERFYYRPVPLDRFFV